MTIPMYLKPELKAILGDTPYQTAYGGESVGLDLYNAGPVVPVPPASQSNGPDGIKKVLVPTGLHIALPRNYVGLIRERGSVTRTGLIVRAGVVDPGYTGEIFVAVANLGAGMAVIEPGAKMPFQLLVLPCETAFEAITEEEFEALTTDATRLQASLGSSDSN